VLGKLGLLALSLLSSVALLELGLRLFTVHPVHGSSNRTRNAELGWVVSSDLPDIDRHGFRNPEGARERVDIVALGDSHTYGQGVSAEHAWPRQLGRLAGARVYNFGVPGYGPVQYDALLGDALKLRPQHVVIGLYLPNDLHGVCHRRWASRFERRARELGVDAAGCRERGRKRHEADELAENGEDATGSERSALASLVSFWLSDRRTAGLVARARRDREAGGPGQLKIGRGGIVVSTDAVRTSFTRHRLRVLARNNDRSQRDIETGWRFLAEALRDASRRCREAGVSLSVLLVPSKELVLHEHLVQAGIELPDSFDRIVARELALLEATVLLLDELGVPHDSPLEELRELLGSERLYPDSVDGHPLAAGQLAYARVAAALVAGSPPQGRNDSRRSTYQSGKP